MCYLTQILIFKGLREDQPSHWQVLKFQVQQATDICGWLQTHTTQRYSPAWLLLAAVNAAISRCWSTSLGLLLSQTSLSFFSSARHKEFWRVKTTLKFSTAQHNWELIGIHSMLWNAGLFFGHEKMIKLSAQWKSFLHQGYENQEKLKNRLLSQKEIKNSCSDSQPS